jgi:hypothetical protein
VIGMNPHCPEPNCKRVMRLRHLEPTIEVTGCPRCRISKSKPYILTERKKGMRKCMQCRQDFKPKRRGGRSKYWVCEDHPWQKFKVGSEVIRCKGKPKSEREIDEMLKPLMVEQAWERRQQPNIQMQHP